MVESCRLSDLGYLLIRVDPLFYGISAFVSFSSVVFVYYCCCACMSRFLCLFASRIGRKKLKSLITSYPAKNEPVCDYKEGL